MTLHQDEKLFSDAIRATSDYLGIMPIYVEKDYWITHILQQLSRSQYADNVVWKGGTSLSKGYGLIDRFSSDIDIAVLAEGMNGNQIKTLISKVNKEMAAGMPERDVAGETSKGSRYRKTYHFYDTTLSPTSKGMSLLGNYVIIEINSFANPYPYVRRTINSFIGQFLIANNLEHLSDKYDLKPFEVNILDMRRTLCEKAASLIRYSFVQPPVEGLRKKIRHFYDLYFLLNNEECKEYLQGDFVTHLQSLVDQDQAVFDEPQGWARSNILSSPLLSSFEQLWPSLSVVYENELSQLAYRPIPASSVVKDTMNNFLRFLNDSLEKKY